MIFGLLLVTAQMGCADMWHNLQPHRLHRMNRGPAPTLDPEFSAVTPDKAPVIMRAQSSDEGGTLD